MRPSAELILNDRKLWNAILRRYYRVGLADIDIEEARDLVEQLSAVRKFDKGEDPTALSPAEWFAQNNGKPVKKDSAA